MNRSNRRILYLVLVTCIAAGGCASTPTLEESEAVTCLERTSAVYLNPALYHNIYMEIDSVEGCYPGDRSIDVLVNFLKKHTGKTITVVKKKPIPSDLAKKRYPTFLAIQNIQGPGDSDSGQSTAYMYILFYDSKESPDPVPECAFVCPRYPCAIYIDMHEFNSSFVRDRYLPFALMHETGHLLGLCANREHGDGVHCKNNCVAGSCSITGGLLGILPDDLCEDCVEDLRHLKETQAASNCFFQGPVLIRKEEGYYVATLPSLYIVGFGSDKMCDWKEAIHKTLESSEASLINKANGCIYIRKQVTTRDEYEQKLPAIESATKDLDPKVANFIREWKKQLDAKFAPATCGS